MSQKRPCFKQKHPESDKEPGYVYILPNPSFREDWVKIGKGSRPVNVGSKMWLIFQAENSLSRTKKD